MHNITSSRNKIMNIRDKLFTIQKEIIEGNISPKKYKQAILLEFILDSWTDIYRENQLLFWYGENLNVIL